jgi:hypothetical protein
MLWLAAGTENESKPLEAWVANRSARQTVTSAPVAPEQAWYPDPQGGWRWWTGYAWGAHAETPIPPIPDS